MSDKEITELIDRDEDAAIEAVDQWSDCPLFKALKKRNPKRALFCQLMAMPGSGTTGKQLESARKAGYTSDQAGAHLMRNPSVKAVISELQRMAIDDVEINAAALRRRVMEVALQSMQAIPIVDEQGVPTGQYRHYPSVALQAFKMLGMDIGMFVEKKDITSGGKSLENKTVMRFGDQEIEFE